MLCAKRGAGDAAHLEALGREPRPHRLVGMRRDRGRLQPLDDVGRRARLEHQSEPRARRQIGVAQVRQGRHVGQQRGAFRPARHQRPQRARARRLDRGLELRETEQRMSRQEIDHLRGVAAVGHLREGEAEALVELVAEKMRDRARAVIGVGELAAIGLCPVHPLLERRGRHARMRHQHERGLDPLDHRNEVGPLPAQIAVARRIDLDHRLGGDPHLAAIGGPVDHPLRGEVAVGAGLDLDDHRPGERHTHVLGDDAGVDVDRAARRRADGEANGARALRQAVGAERADQHAQRGRADAQRPSQPR